MSDMTSRSACFVAKTARKYDGRMRAIADRRDGRRAVEAVSVTCLGIRLVSYVLEYVPSPTSARNRIGMCASVDVTYDFQEGFDVERRALSLSRSIASLLRMYDYCARLSRGGSSRSASEGCCLWTWTMAAEKRERESYWCIGILR